MNIANKLTVLRVVLMPLMLFLVYQNHLLLFLPGFILAIIIAFTDLFDGYLARKYSIVTDFGKFLDPVADKIFIISILLLFLSKNYIPIWFFLIILVREFTINDFRLFAMQNKTVVHVSSMGKGKAMLQFILLFYMGIIRTLDLSLGKGADHFTMNILFFRLVLYAFIIIVSGFTLLSMFDYLWKNRKLIEDI